MEVSGSRVVPVHTAAHGVFAESLHARPVNEPHLQAFGVGGGANLSRTGFGERSGGVRSGNGSEQRRPGDVRAARGWQIWRSWPRPLQPAVFASGRAKCLIVASFVTPLRAPQRGAVVTFQELPDGRR